MESPMSDDELVDLFWKRNQIAITKAEEVYGELCHSISYHILNSHEDAEECTNDTWHRAWNTMPPQWPDSLRAYLCRIVRNISLDRWRMWNAKKRGSGLELLLDELDECVPSASNVEYEVELRELGREIEEWLNQQNTEERILFLRRYWLGMSIKEIAQWSHCTTGRISQKLHRLRRALRTYLEKKGCAI